MKRWKKIMLWLTVAPIVLLATVFALLYLNIRPTTGPEIEVYSTPRTALIVIDIQEDYTGPQAKKRYRDGDRIVAAANILLEQARQKGMPVVYIENVIDNPVIAFFAGGVNAPNAPGTEMDRRLLKIPGTRTFIKSRSDAFSNPDLDTFLRKNQVNRLLVTGLDAAYCVNATTKGALNRGYKVTLFPEAIATESGTSMDKLAKRWREAGAEVKSGVGM
jgi:nicotinamidase-related amidase